MRGNTYSANLREDNRVLVCGAVVYVVCGEW